MKLQEMKKSVEGIHKMGHKFMIIGQPIAGGIESINKDTYISAMAMLSPINAIDLLLNYNIMSALRIISHFPIDYNRNQFMEEAIDIGADYLMFMDMDMTFPADTIMRLMEYCNEDQPVVSGMYYKKQPPYSPVCGRYTKWDDELKKNKTLVRDLGFMHRDGRQLLYFQAPNWFNQDKPFFTDVIGMGCVIMHLDKIKKLPKPYFKYSADPKAPTIAHHLKISEDMYFCALLKKHGIPIIIDPRVQCGHISKMTVDYSIYEGQRDASIGALKSKDPEKFKEILKDMVDLREEQNNGTGIKTNVVTPRCGTEQNKPKA